jgi:hypothetical protein
LNLFQVVADQVAESVELVGEDRPIGFKIPLILAVAGEQIPAFGALGGDQIGSVPATCKSTSSVCLAQPKLSSNRWRLSVTAIIAATARAVARAKAAAAEITRQPFRIAITLDRIAVPVRNDGGRSNAGDPFGARLCRPPLHEARTEASLRLRRVLDKFEHLSRIERLFQNCGRSAYLRPSGYQSAWLAREEHDGDPVAAAPKVFEKLNPAQPPRHIYVDDEAIVAGRSVAGEESFGGKEILYDVTRRVIIDDEDHLPMQENNGTIRIDLNQGSAELCSLRPAGFAGTIA